MQKLSCGKFHMALVSVITSPFTASYSAIEKKLSSPPFLKQALQI